MYNNHCIELPTAFPSGNFEMHLLKNASVLVYYSHNNDIGHGLDALLPTTSSTSSTWFTDTSIKFVIGHSPDVQKHKNKNKFKRKKKYQCVMCLKITHVLDYWIFTGHLQLCLELERIETCCEP